MPEYMAVAEIIAVQPKMCLSPSLQVLHTPVHKPLLGGHGAACLHFNTELYLSLSAFHQFYFSVLIFNGFSGNCQNTFEEQTLLPISDQKDI